MGKMVNFMSYEFYLNKNTKTKKTSVQQITQNLWRKIICHVLVNKYKQATQLFKLEERNKTKVQILSQQE